MSTRFLLRRQSQAAIGTQARRAGRDPEALGSPRYGAQHVVSKKLAAAIVFALAEFGLATAAVASSGTHIPHHSPKQIYKIDVRCAAAAAALFARLPATSSEEKRQKTNETLAQVRDKAIRQGVELSISADVTDRRIQRSQAKFAAASQKLDHGAPPTDGVINWRLFIPSLDCELDQLGDAINARQADIKRSAPAPAASH